MNRLQELERAYSALPFQHTYWKNLQTTIPLDRFRDNYYLGQQTTRASYDYVKSVDREGWIEKLGEDDAFGAQPSAFDGKKISRDLLDSVLELQFARDTIGSALERAKVLDIGAGYGRLAHRITALWPEAFVYCTDGVAVSTRVCEIYLEHRRTARAETVPFHELHKIPNIDVAMNVHSWSECTFDAIEFWLNIVDERGVRYLLVVPHRGSEDGYLRSDDGQNYWPSIERRGFRCIKRQPKYPPHVDGFEPTIYFMFAR